MQRRSGLERERERELGVVSSTLSLFLDSVVSGKLKGECVCLGKGMEGATMSDVA